MNHWQWVHKRNYLMDKLKDLRHYAKAGNYGTHSLAPSAFVELLDIVIDLVTLLTHNMEKGGDNK